MDCIEVEEVKIFHSGLQYQYQYEVKDPEKQLFFDKNEAGDASGKVRK